MVATKHKTSIFWHRRDLRSADNAALYYALKSSEELVPIFIFDTTILRCLPKNDQRILFIHQYLQLLQLEYQKYNSDLRFFVGDPKILIPQIMQSFKATALFANSDYEPKAIERDQTIVEQLRALNIAFFCYKDQVIFDTTEILKKDSTPYLVFTPYSKKWKEKSSDFYLTSYPSLQYFHRLKTISPQDIPTIEQLGFEKNQQLTFPDTSVLIENMKKYHQLRDYPALNATSRLSVHLRFGTISIRELARTAIDHSETFLNELIWREFYMMLLYHFPHSATSSFRKEYEVIVWRNDENEFEQWCQGKTGYPLVDAAMRELNQTGFMHNRARMVVASFLTKHLLIEWQWGAAYFAEHLLDFEEASNVGGWQWAAGSGCDAAPYFRIFNPITQQERFDPDWNYIKKWVPEVHSSAYCQPIVNHDFARNRCIQHYKKYLKPAN